ncbi:MAG TPA: phosphatidate cytidylyltransferase [Myxococcales bacterium]|nr:phosphatidate cytidylyltransferase [Myxococcales bacterium]
MGALTAATWVRLDAFFAALALVLLLHPRWVPQRPGVERTLWVKLGVFFLVVHATLAVIGLGGPWLKAAMVLVAALASRELTLTLLGPGTEQRPYRWLAMGGAVAIVLAAGTDGVEVQVLVTVLLAGAAMPVLLERPAGARASAGAVALIAFLAGLLPASVYRLRLEHGGLAAFLFILVALNDAGAEAAGRLFGRRPFCSPVSPRKTVEGLLGGLLATALGAIAFAPLLEGGATQLATFALLAALTAVLGDLIFSAIKRDAGCKDFQALLPAHGGLLDRFDSFLVSAACCHLLLQALPVVCRVGG